ncbi:MAG: NUDIX hydrolase [Flavobacteriales bacterium]
MAREKKMKQYEVEHPDLYRIPIDGFFNAAFSVDCVIFGYEEGELKVLLIQRGVEPFEGFWALPGDLVYPHEDLDQSAKRVLNDLTSIQRVNMQQVHTFGAVDRHPLGRVITVGYMALVQTTELNPHASNWAKQTKWHSLKKLPKLAFDHRQILDTAYARLQTLLMEEPIWENVLPEKFTISQFQLVFETILNRQFDKGNFRKKIANAKFLKRLEETQIGVRHRPSLLYAFDRKMFERYRDIGFVFEF